MPEGQGSFKEILPKQGLVFQEEQPTMVMCKPKLLPLKSVTLEKLEKMQKDAQEKVMEQDAIEKQEAAMAAEGMGGGDLFWWPVSGWLSNFKQSGTLIYTTTSSCDLLWSRKRELGLFLTTEECYGHGGHFDGSCMVGESLYLWIWRVICTNFRCRLFITLR